MSQIQTIPQFQFHSHFRKQTREMANIRVVFFTCLWHILLLVTKSFDFSTEYNIIKEYLPLVKVEYYLLETKYVSIHRRLKTR